jgi:MerR family transcriptional regulator, light-induced transcriptional regulator
MDSESVARAGQPLPYTGRRRDWDRLRDQFSAALISGDETGARRVFERLRLARVPLADQCEQLLAPAMRRIGDECEVGALSGARLRVAVGIAERALAWAASCLEDTAADAPRAIVITPKGDDHRLPALMAATVLRDGYWAVRQIEGVDAAEVAAVARRLRPGLAVVSFALTDLGDAVAELAGQLADEVGIPLLVGGPGEPLGALREQADALHRAGLSSL